MQTGFHIVLVEPRYDGNIGSVARVMKNFGFKNLVLINPPEIGAEGRRNAMHARDVLDDARLFANFEDMLPHYDFLVGSTAKIGRDGNTRRTPVFVDDLGGSIETDGDIALLFGREDYGLLNEEIEACDMLVTIPSHHEYPTLNLAQSVGIMLYELTRQQGKKRFTDKKFKMLSKIEKDVLLRFYDGLVDNVMDHEFENNIAKKTFRQLLGRAFVSGREARTLTGIIRKAMERTSN